jgi:hypothetical protein
MRRLPPRTTASAAMPPSHRAVSIPTTPPRTTAPTTPPHTTAPTTTAPPGNRREASRPVPRGTGLGVTPRAKGPRR